MSNQINMLQEYSQEVLWNFQDCKWALKKWLMNEAIHDPVPEDCRKNSKKKVV